ncbi:MAG: hypothetical protein ACRD9W_25135, partial [Terriglobia bacterium]
TARTVASGSFFNSSRTEYISSPTGIALETGLEKAIPRKAKGIAADIARNDRREYRLIGMAAILRL